MDKQIESFHFLTQDMPHRTHEEQVQMASEAGVKWVQLRVKNKSFEEWLTIAQGVQQITLRFGITLIINDNINIAKEVDADGVQLGRDDDSWQVARNFLGGNKIIGLSTHSFEELFTAKDFDVDYFGLGPFRFTFTKENIDPVLGLDGIESIVSQAREEGIFKPIIAIGGIQLNDLTELMSTGINGIAVSSAVNSNPDPVNTIHQFLNRIEVSKNKVQADLS